jgi:hypothetical protein
MQKQQELELEQLPYPKAPVFHVLNNHASLEKDVNKPITDNHYGACSRCSCQAFEGSENVCTNCGHNFYDHW